MSVFSTLQVGTMVCQRHRKGEHVAFAATNLPSIGIMRSAIVPMLPSFGR